MKDDASTSGQLPRFPFQWKPRQHDSSCSQEFDGTPYRYCCSLVHAKVAAFVLITVVTHEIILGLMYVMHDPSWTSDHRRVTIALVRLVQLIPALLAYLSLWKRSHLLLLPFLFSQIFLGSYADVCTYNLLLSASPPSWISSTATLSFIPLFLYALFILVFSFVIFKCYVYFRARSVDFSARSECPVQHTQLESLM